MQDFITTLQTWFYRGAGDMIHDEQGLDAFDTWISDYEIAVELVDEPSTPPWWQNADSVALNVWQLDDRSILVKQDNEYAWQIPYAALNDMPAVNPSQPIDG